MLWWRRSGQPCSSFHIFQIANLIPRSLGIHFVGDYCMFAYTSKTIVVRDNKWDEKTLSLKDVCKALEFKHEVEKRLEHLNEQAVFLARNGGCPERIEGKKIKINGMFQIPRNLKKLFTSAYFVVGELFIKVFSLNI